MDLENEMHALFMDCSLYVNIRHGLIAKPTARHEGFIHLGRFDKLKIILGCQGDILVNECAKIYHHILSTRRKHMSLECVNVSTTIPT